MKALKLPIRYLLLLFFFYTSCDNAIQHKRHDIDYEEVDLIREQDVDDLVLHANNLYLSDDYEKAIVLFDVILSIDSMKGNIYYQRGYSEMQVFDYPNAEKDFLKAIELNYRVEDAYFSLGCVFAATYNDTIALQYFQKAHEADSTNKRTEIEIGRIKRRLGISET